MRYSIPKDKDTQDQEWKQILRSLTGAEARTADQALKFIMDQTNGTEPYDSDKSYRKLYGFYTQLGLEPKHNMDAFFNENERSLENFRKELEKFWRVLEIHSLNPGSSLQDNYKNIKAAPAKYDQMLQDAEAHEKRPGGMKEVEPEDAPEQTWDDGALPLVNKKSPYYAAVVGTVYEEMYDLWQTIRKNGYFRQKGDQLLKEDMEQLLSKMQLHYIRHNRSGSYLPMTEKEHKELQNLHGECIKDLSRFSITEALKPTCETLNTLLVQNKNQLDGLSPDQLPPLAGVLRGTKPASVEFNNRNKKKIGGAMSSREAVEYTDENGIRHRGFFTPEVEEKSEVEDAKKLFLKYKQKCPQYASILNNLFTKKYEDFRVVAFYTMVGTEPEKGSKDPLNQYINGQRWIPVQAKKDTVFNRMLRNLAIEVGKNVNRHGILEKTGMGTGDKIAGRACAMSDVARALGFPELLVESKRITVKDGNKEIKGVMTEAAGLDTADFGYMLYTDPFYTKMDREQLNSKEMLSSLADLQILDYLCGNTDRHANNFFLKQDFSDPKHPKLLGVLGIDNDNSFGAIEEGGVQQLAHQSDLQIITPKMADAIEKMTQEDLSNLLKPYEFKKEQMDAAKTRLENLKTLIKEGRKDPKLQIGANGKIRNKASSIHIVQENEWEKLDLKKLTPEIIYKKDKDGKITKDEKGNPIVDKYPVNIFTMAQSDYDIHHEAEKDRKAADYRKVPYSLGPNKGKAPIQYNEQKQKEPEKQPAPELDYATLDMLHQQEAGRYKEIKESLYNNGGDRMNKRSGEFKEMWSALDKYITSYETLHDILMEDTRVKPEDIVDEKKDLTAEQKAAKAELQTWRKGIAKERKLEAFYREMEKAKKDLDQKIDAYHNRYRRRISTRNQNRIDVAAQLKSILAEKTTSRSIYEQYQASKKSNDTIQNTAQQITNMENQIYGKMRFTLYDNLKKHSADDPIRALGTKALEAQQRLWNYSMNGLDQGNVSVKRPEKKDGMTEEQYQRERMPFEKLQKAIQEEKNKNPNIDQVQKDLKTLALYTSQLAESGVLPKATANEFSNMIESIQKVDQDAINRIGQIDENAIKAIPSREIRGVLHTLYQNELTIAQEPEKKMEKNPENGKKSLIQERNENKIDLANVGGPAVGPVKNK